MPAIPNAEMGWEDGFVADICRWPYVVSPEDQLRLLIFRGDPVPAARARVTRKGGAYYPKTYAVYRKNLRASLEEALRATEAEPDAESKFGLKAVFFRRSRQRTDVDNLLKAICDACTGLIWHDDSQVIETFGRVCYDSQDPRVVLLVYFVQVPESERAESQFTCKRCGKVVQCKTPHEAGKKVYCSEACRYPARVSVDCKNCGKSYTSPPSLIKYGYVRACSQECANELQRKKSEASRNKSDKPCADCGKPVSKPSYEVCRPCLNTRLKGGGGNYKWVK
jgi:Holliday junction resolvase RusA-like endonuclease